MNEEPILVNPLLDIFNDEEEPHCAEASYFHYRHCYGFDASDYDPTYTDGRLDKSTLRTIIDKVN